MHELSVAEELLAQIESIAAKEGAGRVLRATVLLGPLSGIEREPLEFAFQSLADSPLMKGAELYVEESPLTLHCRSCGRDSDTAGAVLRCGFCGSEDVSVAGGREFTLKSLEVE